MAVLAGVFLAFGWCDPREYQRKLGLDIFSGVMAIVALRTCAHIKDVVYATVTPQTDGKLFDLSSILQFATGYYEQMKFNDIFNSVDNQLLALIVIGIGIMFVGIVSILSVVFGIYFVFRMCVLLDVYINNTIRFIIMGAALVITLIYGLAAHQVPLMLITLLIGIISIIKLAIGHVLLYYYDEDKQMQPAHAKVGAPAKRQNGRPSAPADSGQAMRSKPSVPGRTQPPVNRQNPASTRQAGGQQASRVPPSRTAPTGMRQPRPQVKTPAPEDFPFTSTLRDMTNPKNPAARTRPEPKPSAERDDDDNN